MRSKLLGTTVLASFCLLAAACGSSGSSTAASTSTSGGGKQLNIYAWADEIPQSVVTAFEQQTGIKVTIDTFTSNEDMITKLSAGGSGYDLVEPSQYAVKQMIAQKLIEPVDHAKIAGWANLAARFQSTSFDPGDKYSIPWIWGTTGLAYNDTCTGGPVTSWKALLDAKYKGKIYMLDNMLSAYIVGLQVNGYRATSTNPTQIAAATTTLEKQKPLLGGYNSTNYPQLLASGQACVAEAYSGTAMAKVVASDSHVHFVMPSEGGTLWTDSLSIASGAANITSAYKFLNFVLQPKIAAMATDDGDSATANQAAHTDITNTALLNNPAVYPADSSLTHADFILDPGSALTYFTQGWTQVRAS